MKTGDWYKKFGSLEDRHDTVETYYHVVSLDEESVYLDEYSYYTHFQRLVKSNKKPIKYKLKSWLEENLRNNVYEVPKENLPFLLGI